jgi:hypothetical protein
MDDWSSQWRTRIDALARRFFDLNWIARARQSRAPRITVRGGAALRDELGIEVES